MQVILLQRIGRLGQMGDIVNVKDGYARNFLLPQKKALRATDENKKVFEGRRSQLEADNLAHKTEAEAVSVKLDGQVVCSHSRRRRHGPALRLGIDARYRRRHQRRRLYREP